VGPPAAVPATAPADPERETVPDVRLVDLTKRFGDVVAVDAISLDTRTGEFFSLLGPSGCGKTTTLRMIGGFEAPSGGRIELRGRDMTAELDPVDVARSVAARILATHHPEPLDEHHRREFERIVAAADREATGR